MSLSKAKITKKMKSHIAVSVYDAIDSTNNEAKRRYDPSSPVPALYAADLQTAGRGRRGHSFFSPKGSGLYMTLAYPAASVHHVQKVTCAAAVAVCEAIDALSDRQPGIKWVNDILIDGRKVAGILTELIADRDNTPRAVIIGIGLNLTTESFPAEFADRAGCIGDVDPNALCATIADRMTELFHDLDDPAVMTCYAERNVCIGRTVGYTDGSRAHAALAVGIDPNGGLIVEEDGCRATLSSGEISVTLSP